jgi:hypothetical protein
MSEYKIWEAWGIELEYMVVDQETLGIRPEVPWILESLAGFPCASHSLGAVTLSNELVSHVLELKFDPTLEDWDQAQGLMEEALAEIMSLLEPRGLSLLGTGAHPWMDPRSETVLWEGEDREIYKTYHQIFNCHRHGWANLQSQHINFSFRKEKEYLKLHRALRILAPLIPGLCASTPVLDGVVQPVWDARLVEYAQNQKVLPIIAGQIIPEDYPSLQDYQHLLDEIAASVQELDPQGVLDSPFLNSRGLIVREERGSIELRLMDLQECPAADLLLAELVWRVAYLLAEEGAYHHNLLSIPQDDLVALYQQAVKEGEGALVGQQAVLDFFDLEPGATITGIWSLLLSQVADEMTDSKVELLQSLLRRGTLSTAIRQDLGTAPQQSDLKRVYAKLNRCLKEGFFYFPDTP